MSAIPGNTPAEIINNLVLYINKILNLVGEYDLQQVDDETVVLMIK